MLRRVAVATVVVLALAATACADDPAVGGSPSGTSSAATRSSGSSGGASEASVAPPGTLQMRPVLETLDASSPEALTCEGAGAATCVADHARDRVVLAGADRTRYALGPACVTEEDVERARASEDQPYGWGVDLQLTPSGTAAFADLTRANQGKKLAEVVDGVVISTPVVEAAITSGSGRVTGFEDRAAAVALAEALGAPA
jgi:preprotein translocase subunit SecD